MAVPTAMFPLEDSATHSPPGGVSIVRVTQEYIFHRSLASLAIVVSLLLSNLKYPSSLARHTSPHSFSFSLGG